MSGHVSTTNGPSIPLDVMSNIEKTLSKSVFGKILEEYIMGEVKLTMWIPEELGKETFHFYSVILLYFNFTDVIFSL